MSTETDAQLNALKEEIAAVRAENEKAWTLARDCYNALVNAKTVGTNGKLGALSGADTLAGAPVGDAAALRSAISAMNNTETLETIPVGTAWLARQRLGLGNDDAGRMALGLGGPTKNDKYNACKNIGITEAGLFTSHLSYVSPLSDPRPTGFYAEQWTQGLGEMAAVAHIQFNGETESESQDNRFIIEIGNEKGGVFYSCMHGGSWSFQRAKMYTERNTTVDGNGFIKIASPIARVGNSLDTLTTREFYPAGDGAVNFEADGVIIKHVEEGVYSITGALDLADDSWNLEIPLDTNNQPLLWVKTAKEENGVITLKTYHRSNSESPSFAQNSIEGKKEGDPIDIPSGRWVDLRLKMPEKEIKKAP